MKCIVRISMLLLGAIALIGFAGCGDDDKATENQQQKLPELNLDDELLWVKIGEENKVEIPVQSGGGDYHAFSTNEDIAKASVVDGKVFVEGIKIGNAYVVVSDKNGFYEKCPVSVYATDVLELEKTDLSFEVAVGKSGSASVNIVKGNLGYKVESDNPEIAVSVTEEGVITVSGKAASVDAEITATITVTDALGKTAELKVRLVPVLKAYTDEELEVIKSDNATRYFYMEGNDIDDNWWGTNWYKQTVEDGKMKYGWDYSSFYHLWLTFEGDNSVGQKSAAHLDYYSYSKKYGGKLNIQTDVTLEVIQNDGTNIWAVYYYMDGEDLKYGYFCDKLAK